MIYKERQADERQSENISGCTGRGVVGCVLVQALFMGVDMAAGMTGGMMGGALNANEGRRTMDNGWFCCGSPRRRRCTLGRRSAAR